MRGSVIQIRARAFAPFLLPLLRNCTADLPSLLSSRRTNILDNFVSFLLSFSSYVRVSSLSNQFKINPVILTEDPPEPSLDTLHNSEIHNIS